MSDTAHKSLDDPFSSAETASLIGQVKWFNVKAGYGFITVVSPTSEYKGKDIFVHFSALKIENALYKYLVQGEYVEFSLIKANSDKYELHATNVSGIFGGSLMCENRAREEQLRTPRVRPDAPSKYEQTEEDGFQKVVRRNNRGVPTQA